MTSKFVKDGRFWLYTATGAVVDGRVITVGTIVGVAQDTAVTGEQINLDTEGVYTVVRTPAASLIAVGANVYFTAAGAAVATATGNVWGGKLETAAATADATCRVAINRGGQGVV